jgi:hypothetical protein
MLKNTEHIRKSGYSAYQAGYSDGFVRGKAERDKQTIGATPMLAALTVLDKGGLPREIQTLLVHGEASRGIAAGLLNQAVLAALRTALVEKTNDHDKIRLSHQA